MKGNKENRRLTFVPWSSAMAAYWPRKMNAKSAVSARSPASHFPFGTCDDAQTFTKVLKVGRLSPLFHEGAQIFIFPPLDLWVVKPTL